MAYTNAQPTHRRCVCRACGEVFSTVSNFDRHRRGKHDGDRHCADPASVGLVIGGDPDNGGTFWRMPGRTDEGE